MDRIQPGPGQESVWDYPRPPRVEPSPHLVRVEFAGTEIARSSETLRVLETSHPPVYYVPFADVATDLIVPTTRRTYCEFKGGASYYSIQVGEQRSVDAAWSYPDPARGYEALAGFVAFYPGRVDACGPGLRQAR